MIAKMYARSLDLRADMSQMQRFIAATWVCFARRVFHNHPPSWHSMGPWLLELALTEGFDPNTRQFAADFKEWANS